MLGEQPTLPYVVWVRPGPRRALSVCIEDDRVRHAGNETFGEMSGSTS